MKKILLTALTIGTLFAQNIYLIVDNKVKNDKAFASFIDKQNKIFTYAQPLQGINIDKIKPTFENAKKELCKKPTVQKLLKEGYQIEFIYIGKQKSVLMRFTDCN
ncbi:hypothetical protein [Caminibacter pacificus]|jgi:hypothetical protein